MLKHLSFESLRDESIAMLFQGASGSLLVKILGMGIAFVASVVIARILGPDQYGIYVYILAWLAVLALVSQLGFYTVTMRFVAAYLAKEQWSLARGVISYTTIISVLASVAVAALAGLFVFLMKDHFGSLNSAAFFYSLPLVLLITIAGMRASALRALKRAVISAVPESIVRPVLIVLVLGLYALQSDSPVIAKHAFLVNIAATLVVFLIGSILLLKSLPMEVRVAQSEYEKRKWWRASLPMFFSTGMTQILAQADILLVGIMLGATQAGFYAVASRLASFAILGKQAADSITAPMIAEFYATDQRIRLSRLVVISARGVTVFTVITALALTSLGKWLLGMFGHEFTVGYMPMIVLLIGHLFKASFSSAGYLLSMTGHQDYSAVVNGICAALNIVLILVLIPQFGMTGAAVATAITNAIWSISLMTCAWHLIKINPTAFSRLPKLPTD